LVDDLGAKGVEARYLPTIEAIVGEVVERARSGDVVAVLSNGGFGGIHDKLLQALRD
jgi:UDP-N-acetylmuramate: L-alanyl-gamma-D-glutamyl-meso-diaminopimelate ligase